jgi:hypothetical protein
MLQLSATAENYIDVNIGSKLTTATPPGIYTGTIVYTAVLDPSAS